MSNRKILELDCDGVILDIHSAMAERVRNKFSADPVYSNFTPQNYNNWGMTAVRTDVREYIFSLFRSVEFMRGLKPFDGALDALRDLDKIAKEFDFSLEVNTSVFNNDIAVVRRAWLNCIMILLNIDFKIHIGFDSVKSMLDNTILTVEDHLENLRNSNARFKYIVNHSHNIELHNSEYSDVFTNAKRVFNLKEVVQDFKALMYK